MKKISLFLVSFILLTSWQVIYKNPTTSKEIKEVKIGNQIWMAENLNADTFRNGDIIPQAKTVAQWTNANELEQPAWCYYANKTKNGLKYGKLYNGYAVNDKRGIAPIGFHVPSDEEWTVLNNFLNNKEKSKEKLSELKFNLQLGGYRYDGGVFNDIDKSCFWWSTTEYFESKNALLRQIDVKTDSVMKDIHSYEWGFYVRCIKD